MIERVSTRILYFAPVFDGECLKKFFDNKCVLSYAASKYHMLLSEGLSENNAEVHIMSVLPVNRTNCQKKYVRGFKDKKNNIFINYMSVINIPLLKHLLWFAEAFFHTLIEKRNTVILYDVLYTSVSLGTIIAAKIRGQKLVGIVTDLPDFSLTDQKAKNVKVKNITIDASDAYILLTSQMNQKVNHKNKPYIVLEGHIDNKMVYQKHKAFSNDKKIIIYAGSIMKKYGISALCRDFIKYSRNDEELHIYGLGDYEDEIKKLEKQNSRIIYHGNRPNEEVVSAELNATLLVNPRPTHEDYTKYSFPSKTLEYMVSGTPVLTSRLPGIPKEYDEYLFYFNDGSADDLGKKMREILDMEKAELQEKGERAREFALREKSNITQAKKIIKFIGDNFTY